jgi:hypothetical protein
MTQSLRFNFAVQFLSLQSRPTADESATTEDRLWHLYRKEERFICFFLVRKLSYIPK